MKSLFTLIMLVAFHCSIAQFYSGYYVSDPQVHEFDHFKIKHFQDQTKLDGDLSIRAYTSRGEMWHQKAHFVSDDSQREEFINKYNHGEEITSVHILKFLWDGNEWEYILLGYLDDKHRHFIVIEEVFNDETETILLEFNRFDWVKGHHIISTDSN